MINKSLKIGLGSLVIGLCALAYAIPTFAIDYENGAKPTLRLQAQQSATKPAVSAQKYSSLKLEGDISLTKQNPMINLSLRDSDVQQVLRMFADKAGLNIVFQGDISKKVTLDLVNVPLNQAFKLVMQVSDLTYFIDKNTMVIASAKDNNFNIAKQQMIIIPVKYIDAGTIAGFLNKNIFSMNKPGLSSTEIVTVNPANNELLIFGTENDAKIAMRVIEKFDIKPKTTTFLVNHTTPKEMADLVCNLLLPSTSGGVSGGGGSSSSSSSSSSDSNTNSSDSTTGGAANIKGVVTGGANSESEIALGENVIACTVGNQVSAGSLASFPTQNLSVAYFPQRGTLEVLGGSDQQVSMIKEFIQQNDRKQPQALLEMAIIELTESGSRQFDNTWQIMSNFFSASFASGTTTSSPTYPTFLSGDSVSKFDSTDPTSITYTLSKYSGPLTITWAINYIIENKKGRVLANPKIVITNGQKSTIDMTSDYVKTVTSEVLSNSLIGATQRTYEIGDDNGIKVEMVPFISPEGYVTLNITPDYTTIKESVYQQSSTGLSGQDLAATLLQRRNLELKNIRIKDGETLVIAGMINEDEQKSVKKLPVLGDIPGLGMLFRSTSTTKSKTELVIMLTPRIIKDSEDMLVNNL